MYGFFTEVRDTIAPRNDAKHGPLPPLLLAMTLVTGLVDAFSYLVLGHVFVANMTGNVVFLGFALAGASGFSIGASLAALASFVTGALIGGKVGSRLSDRRDRLLSAATTIQALLLGASVVLCLLSGHPVKGAYQYLLIVVLGIAMGMQNATARKLAVPDLTTTVLTLTITGLGADNTVAGGTGAKAGRRLTAIAAMLAGALVGAILVIRVRTYYPLVIATVMIVGICAAARLQGRSNPSWVRP